MSDRVGRSKARRPCESQVTNRIQTLARNSLGESDQRGNIIQDECVGRVEDIDGFKINLAAYLQ